jgi:hypothetical protein
MREIPGEEMEDGVWLDLKWFGPPEHNTLCPLFLYCSSKSLNKLVSVCV